MDLAGRLWQEGKLADKVATAFRRLDDVRRRVEQFSPRRRSTTYKSSSSRSATRRARCSTPGATRMAPRTRAGKRSRGPDEKALAVARYQGQRLARYAAVVAAAREADAFRVKRPRPERFRAAALGQVRGCSAVALLARCRSVCDQPGTATVGCEAERPADEDEQSVLEADQVPEVDEQPGRPGGKAAPA